MAPPPPPHYPYYYPNRHGAYRRTRQAAGRSPVGLRNDRRPKARLDNHKKKTAQHHDGEKKAKPKSDTIIIRIASNVGGDIPKLSDPEPFDSNPFVNLTNYMHSPTYYPTPMAGRINDHCWRSAFLKAKAFVTQLTNEEKANLTTDFSTADSPWYGETGEIPRLNLSSLRLQWGLHGVGGDSHFTTFLPAGITTASTFNKGLMYSRGAIIGKEARKKGMDIVLGPLIDPTGRSAAGGRNWEGFGPDPYMAGVVATESVTGIQDQGVVATVMHYVGYSQEHFRNLEEWQAHGYNNLTSSGSSFIDDRTMNEVYIWPFANAVKANAGAIMCAPQKLNNTQGCKNSYMMNYKLKRELGFQGFVLSAGMSQNEPPAALAGMDMSMPRLKASENKLREMMLRNYDKDGFPQSRLDDMATRVLTSYYYVTQHRNGHQSFVGDEENLSNKSAYDNILVDVRDGFHYRVALEIALEGIVMLKNDDSALPIEGMRTIGVLGAAANLGPSGSKCDDKFGCHDGAIFQGWGDGGVNPPFVVTPYEAVNARAARDRIVVRSNFDSWDLNQAEAVASSTDANIIFVAANSGEGNHVVDDNKGDRKNFTLWHNGDELIKKAVEVNDHNIVVVTAVGPVDMEKWIEHPHVKAVLFTGPGGEEAGAALAHVLFGDFNPSGKLPFTIARNVNHYIPIETEVPRDGIPKAYFGEMSLTDYKWFDQNLISPRFEFGFGMSFSEFSYSDMKITTQRNPSLTLGAPPDYWGKDGNATTAKAFQQEFKAASGDFQFPSGYNDDHNDDPVLNGGAVGGNPMLWDVMYQVAVSVTNHGPFDGAVVSQLYVSFPQDDQALRTAPKQLRGFSKTSLVVGETANVLFDLMWRDLAVWDVVKQTWVVQRGDYDVFIGGSSRQLETLGRITIA
ncbi:glycosyl hydrolase family 3 N terminal domain-domain-containing protein [Yarrowia lipolytica]|uniref:beta-glucosidase n=3 Tax=Yarrowia lipolytica TaxID=4952 RepID=Q6CEN3_YARLI|nr:YALI0B14333p [Yarrowia lipolytica CLIB122]KAB8284930.1 glycosyl hydrolase family 3 N terminal domain-containing protein [Yarrowia lipolytica]KAE8175144.1 glycosyl hydrolase family 3 N terminal domain-containing protein [Yarrowia lipolytica]KAJ8052490.1 glycosyl hydrolase family 3 N terminal domain-containing protein [Yarrowia lipolytica]QNP97146.1 Beta-glucosidase [Yarrowia lipolytica]RDW23805.1 glycosyl hydrolase family 3 N terminal domain-domain-containing protein [Yarrowia lipolytica]|eukprot:XP_500879.1 YALI0B14333p [Yarrowia lipolytica CLIB122]